jgi:hypothetical protein
MTCLLRGLLGGVLASLPACGEPPAAHDPRPMQPRDVPKPVVLSSLPQDGPCGRFTRFDPGEKVQQVKHGQDVDYTLTDRTLYIWRFVNETASRDGTEVAVQHQCLRSDMRAILHAGVTLWHLEGDINYFFTKDRRLIALPHGDLAQMLTYKVDFETATLSAKRISFFGGMIFFAPVTDRLTVMSLEPKVEVAQLEVDVAKDPKAEFIEGNDARGNGRLYFGRKDGILFELFISGRTASSVNALELR